MKKYQFINKNLIRVKSRGRLIAFAIFACIVGFWLIAFLGSKGILDLAILLNPCGMKQRYGLPCPTCGFTTVAIVFIQGRILQAFYIQPAGAILYTVSIISGFLALFTAVFGVYFRFLDRFFRQVHVKYIILALVVIVVAGWAVTLSRALAAGR
ncbi:MAG: DUF2752 domain-containing protein [Phycisphaerae bacterium]|nr:DUF2752 domain-containing protein [Phycisphaerae bacterium]